MKPEQKLEKVKAMANNHGYSASKSECHEYKVLVRNLRELFPDVKWSGIVKEQPTEEEG